MVLSTPAGDHDVGPALDADFCPVEKQQITGSATYLLDLRKPLGDATAPGESLRAVGRDLVAGTELVVFEITEDVAAPRRLLDRFCKPYSEAQVVVRAAKDQGKRERDCDELPAQVSQRVRDLATRFCARRDALQFQIDRLAAQAPRTVPNAHLIEALEETAAAFASRPRPWRLYVFSDMLQHAGWYSHLDLGWRGWSFDVFASRQAERDASSRPDEPAADAAEREGEPLPVTVFYPPRRRITESLRPRYAHQTFWRRYFAARHAEVDFVVLSPAPAMQVPRLMVTPMEELAREIATVLADAERLRAAAQRTELALAELDAPSSPPAAVVEQPPTVPPPLFAPRDMSRRTLRVVEEPPPTVAQPPSAPRDISRRTLRVVEEPAPTAPPLAAAPVPPLGAAPAEDLDSTTRTACVIGLKPEFASSLAPGGYPEGRRVHYGAGVVTVRYAVDEEGRTVDAAVAASIEREDAGQPDWANLAADTAAEVRRWEFTLADSNPPDCELAPQTATFTYVERCRGSPVPTCRTVRANVAVF